MASVKVPVPDHRIYPMQPNPTSRSLISEIDFTTSRSGGPGGQNVNKVNSKVTLRFDVRHSLLLSDEQKSIMMKRLSARMTKEGVLLLSSQDERSQLQNKDRVLAKFDHLLEKAFAHRKPRKKTKPGLTARLTRLEEKKRHSQKKKWRRNQLE